MARLAWTIALVLGQLSCVQKQNDTGDFAPESEETLRAVKSLLVDMDLKRKRVLVASSDLCSTCIVDDFIADVEADVQSKGLDVVYVDADSLEVRRLNSIYTRHNVRYHCIPEFLKNKDYYRSLRSSNSVLIGAKQRTNGEYELSDGAPMQGPARGQAVWDFLLKE